MATLERASIRELFVILEPFAPRANFLVESVRPLSGSGLPTLLGVDAFYRRRTDIALLALRFAATDLTPDAERAVVAVAQRARLPVLDPARLGKIDRERFYGEYLRDYTAIAAERQDAAEALAEVAAHLGIPPVTATGSSPAKAIGSNPRLATEAGRDSGPILTLPGSPAADTTGVYIRFLRGDEWVTGRLGQLSLRGARVATDVPPRDGDLVELAIGFRGAGARLRGHVTRAWPPSSAATAPGFFAAFQSIEAAARQELSDLLRAARAAGATLTPPPARVAARFPVCWPVRIATRRGPAMARALDVSSRGLFLATGEALAGDLAFAVVLGDDADPVRGRGLVAREVSPEMAEARGLCRGYGISIADLAGGNGARYAEFVDQVTQRAARRVVSVAAPARVRELSRGLASAGYAASSVTSTAVSGDLETLLREAQGADMVVLDATAGSQTERAQLQHALARNHLPYITLTSDPPGAARAAVDRSLGI